MDFFVGLPRSQKGNNMIWVIVDQLTKSAHFIPMKDTWSKAELTKAYRRNVVKLHGIPKDIVSHRDSRFICKTWKEQQESLGTQRRCRNSICWDDSVERMVVGPEMVQEMIEQVQVIRKKINAAQDRQKSYADLRRSEIEFNVGDKLRRYVSDLSHVLDIENIELDEQLTYEKVPKEILDTKVRKTRNGEVSLVKVIWSNHVVEEATWETEVSMRDKYPHLFH
ncbi:uncharacterized protein LOC141628760 [Silene latifolia]|uniref:uncharacterized protein LOC141628760 n=1 Tax=Silene latifolia TaxID=37657 RepID=UPI003D76CC67